MAVDGMDVHGARVALGRISGQTGALSNAARSLSGALHALEWSGPDRDHFVAEFDSRLPNLLRAAQAQVALGKILSVLPTAARVAAESLPVYAPPLGLDDAAQANLQILREAVQSRLRLRLRYLDLAEHSSERVVRPLGCFYWGRVWTLACWCETRQAFRSFRIDRVQAIEALQVRFADEAGRTLADFLRQAQAGPGRG